MGAEERERQIRTSAYQSQAISRLSLKVECSGGVDETWVEHRRW